jgi:structural maintenance of chromosome 1
VFQGDVEAVASKSPLELTRMFEHISGSEAYATDYDAVLQQREVAEEKALFALQKKKMFSSQRKEIKEQRDEAYVFTDKKTQLSNLHAQHMLWKIFHIKNEMEQCDEEIASKNNQLHVAMTNEQEAKNSVENVKKDVARANKTLIASEKELMSVQKKVSEIGPVRDATKSKCSKISKKVEELIKSRHLVEIDVKTQQETIVKVNAELVLLTTQESSIRSQLASVMTSLTTEQLQEYSKLKEVAATKVSYNCCNI